MGCVSTVPKPGKPNMGTRVALKLDLPKDIEELKQHKAKLVDAIATIEHNAKELETRCDERAAKIVGSTLFEQRLGGIDCFKFVPEYEDKMLQANSIAAVVPPPSDDEGPKPANEEKKLSPAKEQMLRIQTSTANTHKEEACKFLLDATAKLDWQAPVPMPRRSVDSTINLDSQRAGESKADPVVKPEEPAPEAAK